MGKKNKTKEESIEEGVQSVTLGEPELSYEDKLRFVSPIAKPMASKHLAKRLYKLVKKASKEKTYLRAGLKEVQRRIRLGENGICIFAGNVTPLDVMCHMPGVCEDKGIPYCYIPSRQDLGAAMNVKRGTVMVLIRPHPSYQDLYDEMYQELKSLPIPIDDLNNIAIPQENL